MSFQYVRIIIYVVIYVYQDLCVRLYFAFALNKVKDKYLYYKCYSRYKNIEK